MWNICVSDVGGEFSLFKLENKGAGTLVLL